MGGKCSCSLCRAQLIHGRATEDYPLLNSPGTSPGSY